MIALDANGADGASAPSPKGAPLRASVRCTGPPPSLSCEGLDVADAPGVIGNDEEPVRRGPHEGGRVDRPRRARGCGRRGRRRSCPRARTGATLAASGLHMKRIRGVHRPAVAVLLPVPGGPSCCSTRARTEVRPEHLGPVRLHGLGASWRPSTASSAREVGLLSNGEEAGKGTPDVRGARAPRGPARPELRGQRRGRRPDRRRARRRRHRRLHRQRRAEGDRGHLAHGRPGDPRGDQVVPVSQRWAGS